MKQDKLQKVLRAIELARVAPDSELDIDTIVARAMQLGYDLALAKALGAEKSPGESQGAGA